MNAHKIFLVRPGHFGFNPETAHNNVFQHPTQASVVQVQNQVKREFEKFVEMLQEAGIHLDILDDDPLEQRLDAIFPNNWFTTHPNGTFITYPMYASIRRKERDPSHIQRILSQYRVTCHIGLEHYESENMYLEGTGSLIIDHEYGIVYANRSPRTHEIPFHRVCQLLGYVPVLFDARDENGIPVYHTNVVMGIGKDFIIINRSAVAKEDWPRLEYYFQATHQNIITISHDQMKNFLGNIAFLVNAKDEPFIVMSDSAFHALEDHQYRELSKYGILLHSNIATIEKIGGGSAKCMIAENYLNRR